MRPTKISILVSSFILFYSNVSLAADLVVINPYAPTFKKATSIREVAPLNKLYQFKIAHNITLPNAKQKRRFLQYYQNIPVWGTTLTSTHLTSGEDVDTVGSYYENIEKDLSSVKVKISEAEALTIAMMHTVINSSDTVRNKIAELYIMQGQDKKSHLVYQVSFVIDGNKLSRPYFNIDAESGTILEKWEGLNTRDAYGPGGNEKTHQYRYGSEYPALNVTETVPGTCVMDGLNVTTLNMNNQTSGGAAWQFNCPENTYKEVNGAYSPLNDAHSFGNTTFNMYKDWFNKSPLNTKLILRVHYGINYENAGFDGQVMTFGDGLNTYYPLTGLDIVGHEVSHGFTNQYSKLVYRNQSGGLAESFSDMGGEAVKYYNNPNKPEDQRNDWLVMGTVIKNKTALRYFDDPTRDGNSIGHASQYRDGMDPHYSSGVFNKGFYTLVHKPGWNTKKAFSVFVLANQVYWTSDATFNSAACGASRAAKDLGYSQADVISAFNVVGVDASCGTTPPPPTVPELKNNIPVTNLSGEVGSEIHYVVKVPAGIANLTIQITGNSGDADLYTKFGTKPTTSVYDCRPYLTGSNETCTKANPQAGDYYVMVRGYTKYSGVTLVAKY